MRSSDDEKIQQVTNVETFRDLHAEETAPLLKQVQQVARERKNTFEALVKAAPIYGQLTLRRSGIVPPTP